MARTRIGANLLFDQRADGSVALVDNDANALGQMPWAQFVTELHEMGCFDPEVLETFLRLGDRGREGET